MDEAEFLNIQKNIDRVTDLKNHDKAKQWNLIFAYGTYALEGEIKPNFSMSDAWKVDLESNLSDHDKKRMINFMSAFQYLEKRDRVVPEDIKTVHKIMMQNEKHKNGKDVLVGEYRKTPVFAGFHQFAPVSAIERLVREALNRYYESTIDDQLLKAANLFMDLINIHPFEDGNGRMCRMILSHVLMKSGQSVFPVLLSSFHRRSRRHYLQAVKRYDEKPSMFYTLIATSLVKTWQNFVLD